MGKTDLKLSNIIDKELSMDEIENQIKIEAINEDENHTPWSVKIELRKFFDEEYNKEMSGTDFSKRLDEILGLEGKR